jgi:hypothetical protein
MEHRMSKRTSSPGMRWGIFLVAMSLAFITGCKHAMSSSNAQSDSASDEFPLRFTAHNFDAYCYNTYGCKVLYNNFYHVRDADDKLAEPPETPGEQRYWDGHYLGVVNFPSPAQVTWRSLDGSLHQEAIDIGDIFKDQRILHNVSLKDIPDRAYIVAPSIILVVNDRTIRVYMRAHIPLKKPAIPGNKYSTFRDDLVLAYTHAY